MLQLFVLAAMLSVVFNLIGRHTFDSSNWIALPSLIYSALLFAIGEGGLIQRFDIQDILRDRELMDEADEPDSTSDTTETDDTPDDADDTQTHGNTPAATDYTAAIAQQFEDLMESEQLFLQPNLKLQDVCLRIGTNRTYLLNAISQKLQMTFSEYINRRRIAYACDLMERHPTLPRADVAIRSGYTATASFYRNWKLYAKKDAKNILLSPTK